MNANEKTPCQEPAKRGLSPAHSSRALDKRAVYLSLGSNIRPEINLPRAVNMLCKLVGVTELSQVWETPPTGMRGANFLNAAALVETPLPKDVLKSLILRRIEVELGRRRTGNKYSPRTIDVDIIIYDGQLLDFKLWTQAFLAVPMAELVPDYTNPNTGESLSQAAARLAQKTFLRLRSDVFGTKH